MLDTSTWHPKLRKLHDHWRSIHPVTGLPGRQHLDPLAIPDLLPNIWLMDVQREPFRLRYRLLGTLLVSWIGADHTGRWLDEVIPTPLQASGGFERLKSVVDSGVPSWRRGPPTLFLTHKNFADIERLVLPLARDGRSVDLLMAGTVFHERARKFT